MATTISTQDLIDVKRDIDDVGKAVNENVIVSPRYGEDFKSLPMIAAEFRDAINTIVVEDGVPAVAISDASGKNQQEVNDDQLIENEAIRSDIAKVESYIVYAEKYGASLNEAMAAINTEFAGNRVRVYVPSDFPVTATVNINIDCDLDLSTLQIQNDVDVIFEPIAGWSGSTTPCDVYVNNKSCRLGWNLNKAMGIVELNKMRFFDVGDKTANTSASSWTAFRVSIVNIERIDLTMPSTFNSYVVPNTTVGDEAGTNRNIVIDGIMTASTFASDINIKNPTAVDLETGEDSDALVINTNTNSLANTVFNIDIDNIYCKNVQKRALKVIGWNNASGIRLNGNHVMIGGGVEPLSAIDVSGNCRVDANGSVVGSSWTYGLYVWNGARFIGDFSMDFDLGETQVIRGNQVRGINQNTNPATTVDITRCHIIGGTEFASVIEGHTLNIKDVKHVAYNRSASLSGYVYIGKYALEFKDPAVIPARGSYLIAFNSANKKVVKNLSVISTVSTPLSFVIRSIVTSDVEVTDAKVTGTFTIGFGDLNTASNNKYRRCSISSGTYMFSCTNGGTNLLLDQCKPNAGLIANASANPLTNVIELNTQTF